MCPALIFAARRNDSVIGRTIILKDSIIIKAGESQEGAPDGRNLAANCEGELIKDEIIRDNQSGNPNTNVNNKCEDVPNKYGVNPIKLIIINSKNREGRIRRSPFREFPFLRFNWSEIKFNGD